MSNLDNDKQNIKISVIVASYNYEKYLKETLDSLVNQTYKDFEVVVIDDGSTDNSVDIIKQYTEKYSNFNLYQHANCSNRGLAETLKLGIQKVSGEYIAFLESDDYWDKNYLQEKVEYIKNHKNVYLISNDIQCFGDINIESPLNYISSVRNYFHGNKEKKNHFDMLIKNNNLLPTFSSILIYKKILEKLDFNCPIPEWLDWWLWRQYALKYNIGFIDKKLTYWRRHGESYDYTSEGEFNAKCEKLAEESDKLLKRKYTAAYYKYHLTPCFKSVLKNIFSVRNSSDKRHKMLTILGIKVNFIKKSHNIKSFQFVSLGYNCLTRRVLTEVGLMKSKEQGQLTYPFDLCVTFPDKLVEILDNGFEGYVESIIYDTSKKGYYNTKYNIYYNHDEDCDNNEIGYQKIINRYKSRIDNFIKILSSDEKIIYVLNNYYQSEKMLNKLYNTLNKINFKKFFLIVLDLEDKINESILNKEIIVCKVKHSFEHIDHWWYPENIEKFNNLRDDIYAKLSKILKERNINIQQYNNDIK